MPKSQSPCHNELGAKGTPVNINMLNINMLNDDQVVIDGVRFLSSTLWTDFALFGESSKVFSMLQARHDK